jgi:hypothetical protein
VEDKLYIPPQRRPRQVDGFGAVHRDTHSAA